MIPYLRRTRRFWSLGCSALRMLRSHCRVPSLCPEWVESTMENVMLEENQYERIVKGHVLNSYRKTKRNKLFGGTLAEEKGVF